MGGWIRGAFPKIKNEDDELKYHLIILGLFFRE